MHKECKESCLPVKEGLLTQTGIHDAGRIPEDDRQMADTGLYVLTPSLPDAPRSSGI